MKLLQKDLAKRIGVTKSCVVYWEANRSAPELRFMPAVIDFLGYNPLPPATNWAERLVRHRTSIGLSQEQAARRVGVDPSTLARWERGEREPEGSYATSAERFLKQAAAPTALRPTG